MAPAVKSRFSEPRKVSDRPFYFARDYKEHEVMDAIQHQANPHDYCGYIFSSTSERPPNYYKNYFLPVYPQPGLSQHVHILAPPIPQEKMLGCYDLPPGGLFPLSTVKVQWGVKRGGTRYNRENLYHYFSRFGEVLAVYSRNINSCLVVFAYLRDAKVVVSNNHLGAPWDHLIVSWLNPRLNQANFFQKQLDLQEEEIYSSLGELPGSH